MSRRGRRKNVIEMERFVGAHGVDALLSELRQTPFRPARERAAQKENLKVLLHKYKVWGNTIAPEFTFPEFIAAVERAAQQPDFRDRLNHVRFGLPFAYKEAEGDVYNADTESVRPENIQPVIIASAPRTETRPEPPAEPIYDEEDAVANEEEERIAAEFFDDTF